MSDFIIVDINYMNPYLKNPELDCNALIRKSDIQEVHQVEDTLRIITSAYSHILEFKNPSDAYEFWREWISDIDPS